MENMIPSLSEKIVAYYLKKEMKEIPAEVIEYTKDCIIDFMGCALGGATVESTRMIREIYALGEGDATTVSGERTKTEFAAFINGAAGHTLEMDDTTYQAGGHIAVSVIPAALAVAEETNASGQDLLCAVIWGYDMMTRVGRGEIPDHCFERGWHPTSVNGTFGATVAAGLLYGLDEKKLVSALGIAGGFTSGNLECYEDGTLTKRLNPAHSAMAGVMAARLAAAGFAGPRWIFEGAKGFFRSYTDDPVPENMLKDMDDSSYLIKLSSFKPYACCRYNHCPIDATIKIMKEHGLKPDDVEKFIVDVSSIALRGVVEPREIKYNPPTIVGAQFSLPFAVAVAAIYGNASVSEHSETVLHDPYVHDMMQKVEMIYTEKMNQYLPDFTAAEVTVITKTGEEYTELSVYNKGDVMNPFTPEEFKAKYMSLAQMAVSQEKANEIYDAIRNLDKISVRELMNLMN